MVLTQRYRDSETLRLAAEINDFIRSKTNDSTVASVALDAARATISFVPWPEAVSESSSPLTQSGQAPSEAGLVA